MKSRTAFPGGRGLARLKHRTYNRLKLAEEIGSPGRTRTADPVINSHLLYQLSYRGVD